MDERYVSVILPGLTRSLIYKLPEALDAALGDGVVVPLSRRQSSGWIEKLISKTSLKKEFALDQKEIRFKDIVEVYSCFNQEQLQLFRWIADYYGYTLSEVLDSVSPKRSEVKKKTTLKISSSATSQIKENKDFLTSLQKKAPQQFLVLDFLLENGPSFQSKISESISVGSSAISSLKKKGLLETTEKSVGYFEHCPDVLQPKKQVPAKKLNPNQASALEAINQASDKGGFESFLLHGVTGSGKTEVYLQAISKVLAAGKSALVIVPEIALTPQLLTRFQERFETPIALLHSQVGATRRYLAWKAILEGKVRLAIGARSAVFAPLKDLALIIVDEEHESSYKQSDGLRYHARDVAVIRARFNNCPIVLGSATPSFETLLNVKKGRYKLLEMPNRATARPLPDIELIDLGKIKRKEMLTPSISPPLFEAIQQTLSSSEQAVILYNRRGFSTYLQCDTCAESVACPHCSVTLTYHKTKHRLICHYCLFESPVPEHCRYCRNPKTTKVESGSESVKQISKVGTLSKCGAGTERVYEELHELFPNAVILRMDRDTTTKKSAYEEILGKMQSGEADILLGTQMIAKGHDIPGVTLVGVVDADIGLHLPDFRSDEKVLQLLTQAAGRAGRGENPGRVLIQTHDPNHPTLVATTTGRFKAFARLELEHRKALSYPPWSRLMRVVISHPDAHRIEPLAAFVARAIKAAIDEKKSGYAAGGKVPVVTLLGPGPASRLKLRDRYRWHLLIKSSSAKFISELAGWVNSWKRKLKGVGDLRVTQDVDAIEML